MDRVGVIDDLGGLMCEVKKYCGDDIFLVTDSRVLKEDMVNGQKIFIFFALASWEDTKDGEVSQPKPFLVPNDWWCTIHRLNFINVYVEGVERIKITIIYVYVVFICHVEGVERNKITIIYVYVVFICHVRGVEGCTYKMHTLNDINVDRVKSWFKLHCRL